MSSGPPVIPLETWLTACELSTSRSHRRRRKLRRYAIALNLVILWLVIGVAVVVWWLA